MINKFLCQIQTKIQNLEKNSTKYPSICYILTSTLLLAICSTLSKCIPDIPTSQIVYARAISMLSLNTIVINNFQVPIYQVSTKILVKLICRSVFGSLGTLCFYQAFKYMAVSEGIVIFKTSPLWTSLMAIFYLKVEKFSFSFFGNFGLCISGIILITQPPQLLALWGEDTVAYSPDHFKGVIIMLIGSILASIIQILINSLGGKINQLTILQYFSFISIIISTTAHFTVPSQEWVIPTIYQFSILAIFGIFSFFSQLLMNRAYLIGQLTQMSMLGQTQVLFGYFFDVMLGQPLSFMSICGTLLITASLIQVIRTKSKK